MSLNSPQSCSRERLSNFACTPMILAAFGEPATATPFEGTVTTVAADDDDEEGCFTSRGRDNDVRGRTAIFCTLLALLPGAVMGWAAVETLERVMVRPRPLELLTTVPRIIREEP